LHAFGIVFGIFDKELMLRNIFRENTVSDLARETAKADGVTSVLMSAMQKNLTDNYEIKSDYNRNKWVALRR